MAGIGLMLICYSFLSYMNSVSGIILYALLLRFFQGTASALVQTTCYSIAANDFPDKQEAIVGGVEAATGVGLIFGPVISAIIYAKFSFTFTFTLYGIVLILFSIIIKAYFPDTSTRVHTMLSGTSLDELEDSLIEREEARLSQSSNSIN